MFEAIDENRLSDDGKVSGRVKTVDHENKNKVKPQLVEVDDDHQGSVDEDHGLKANIGANNEKNYYDSKKIDEIVAASKSALLKYYGLSTLCVSTVYRWMKALGMKYCPRKKNFYVDGHERKDVVKYREEYIKQYLKDERLMYRWIQIRRDNFYKLVSKTIYFLL